jgi:UDP-3-O-[3-hydroxymyristoyl] N-acetylglucosamine deacetylase
MYAARNQRTIAAPAAVEGFGYWSGRDARVEFRPAEAGTGIVFVRSDLEGQPRIPALVAHCAQTPLRTTLRRDGVEVGMVEHVMAALAGLQIDNAEVWIDGDETPGCDGSALPFVEALLGAGAVAQAAWRPVVGVRRLIRIGDAAGWIEARPVCAAKTILHYELDYGAGNPIGRQSLEIALSSRHFQRSLAPSRTFLLEHEALALRARGLAARTTCKDVLVFGSDGPIDNALRFPDECVRHKLLDLVGDLALAGCDLVGRFVAYRSGHRLNAALVRAVLADSQSESEAEESLKRCA